MDTSTEIRFNQIHKPNGKRINYTKTVKGIGPIETSDIVKGFEVDNDQYVFLEPEELDAIKLESKKTLDLTQFVDVKDIDPRYFERPYYLVPQDDQAAEGYMVIRQALTKMNKRSPSSFVSNPAEVNAVRVALKTSSCSVSGSMPSLFFKGAFNTSWRPTSTKHCSI